MMDPPEDLAVRPIPTAHQTRGIASGAVLLNDGAELRIDNTVTADPEPDGLGFASGGGRRDLLSELLANVRLNGDRIVAYAPCAGFSIGFDGSGALHMIEEGDLELALRDGERIERLRPGDIVLVPRGDPHHMRDAARTNDSTEKPPRWLSGTFRIGDSEASQMLAALPEAIVLPVPRDEALEGLEVARRMLLLEMAQPSQGSAVMVARILDLMFIQILRVSAADRDGPASWLTGALDPRIGFAVSAIHADPRRDWTVDQLAGRCNLSRSRFSELFADRVGKPPLTYLKLVRLGSAAKLLRDTSTPIGVIAGMVGYASEPAFSRAFRTQYGNSPAGWRRAIVGRQLADGAGVDRRRPDGAAPPTTA
jgi:AraC-like DNA-binding protein